MSRHEILVATSIGVLNLIFCRNLKLHGRDLASPFSGLSWSRHQLSVATNNVLFLCRNLKMVSRHDLSLRLLLSWSQLIFSCRNSFCWAYYHFRSRPQVFFVMTSKLLYYYITCRDLKCLSRPSYLTRYSFYILDGIAISSVKVYKI